MPRIIRRALYRKLSKLPELNQFREDFRRLSGMELVFLDELGQGQNLTAEAGSCCACLHATVSGRRVCQRARQALLEQALVKPSLVSCDAGLVEGAVAVVVGGITAGYFVFAGAMTTPPDRATAARAHYLLQREGIGLPTEAIQQAQQQARTMSPELLAACLRFMAAAARDIATVVTEQMIQPDGPVPPGVSRACQWIRQRALVEDVTLTQVAQACGMSAGHLSRVFHHTTGLTFREYLSALRADHARELLRSSPRGITEIAFVSGFQSVSQFNRVFKRIYQISPREMRARVTAPP